LPEEDLAAEMLAVCSARLAASGFAQYEVSAYAPRHRRCRHNLNYWSFGDYLGVGAGAHGKLTFPERGEIVRTTQPRAPRRYLAAADAALTRRLVGRHELAFEFMLNALRLTEGFAAASFSARTGLAWQAIAATVQAAIGRGLLLRTEDGYRPSALGLRFLNDLLLEFLPETQGKAELSALSMARSAVRSGN
jgi:oxygen-independent coproporphyrinogen-3 oxidase